MSSPATPAPKMPPQAKIIQIAVSGHILYCLADDGSLYRLIVPPGDDFIVAKEDWYQMLPAPPYYP